MKRMLEVSTQRKSRLFMQEKQQNEKCFSQFCSCTILLTRSSTYLISWKKNANNIHCQFSWGKVQNFTGFFLLNKISTIIKQFKNHKHNLDPWFIGNHTKLNFKYSWKCHLSPLSTNGRRHICPADTMLYVIHPGTDCWRKTRP